MKKDKKHHQKVALPLSMSSGSIIKRGTQSKLLGFLRKNSNAAYWGK